MSNTATMEEEESKYFRWVNQVMSSHKAPAIDEFRLQFDLKPSREDNVDNWVRSALEKRVKRLRLDTAVHEKLEEPFYYTFPSLSFCNSLTYLQLARVQVTGEVLEKLLHDCPLEYLSVRESTTLVDFKVVGPSLKLKSLRIIDCFSLQHLEISASNLECVDYSGVILDCPFKSNPKLTKVSIGDEYARHLMYDFSDLSSFISQIELLTLYPIMCPVQRIAGVFPVCTRLKMLDVTISPNSDAELFGLRSLLKACPLLQKFVLRLRVQGRDIRRTEKTRNLEACPHYCLKVVEIIWFVGWESDFGFAEYLIQNVVSLEKIIVEPVKVESPDGIGAGDMEIRAIQQTEKLRSNNPGTEVVIRDEETLPEYFWSFF